MIWEVWKIFIFIVFLLYLYNVYLFCYDRDFKYFKSSNLVVDTIFFVDLMFNSLKLIYNLKDLAISTIIIEFCLKIPINIITVIPFYNLQSLSTLYLIKLIRIIFIWETIADLKEAMTMVFSLFILAIKEFSRTRVQ